LPSPSSDFEEDSDFHEIGSFDDWSHVDSFVFECVTSECLGLYYARVEFNVVAPSSITENEPYATNVVSMSDYYKFTQVVQSIPPVDYINCDFHLGVEFDNGHFDGAHCKFVLYTDRASW